MNTVATLLDSGNFILKELYFNGSTIRVLWQSFDYPFDTLLPGMKLGINHKTGQTWSLTCVLSDEIIAPGPFTLNVVAKPKFCLWGPNRKGYELFSSLYINYIYILLYIVIKNSTINVI